MQITNTRVIETWLLLAVLKVPIGGDGSNIQYFPGFVGGAAPALRFHLANFVCYVAKKINIENVFQLFRVHLESWSEADEIINEPEQIRLEERYTILVIRQ